MLKTKEDVVAKANEFNDLCTTCNFAEECLQRATLIRPVWFCENFDCYQPAPARPARKSEPVAALREDTNGVEGVCRNCGSRDTCLYAKQGVRWFCEEYV